MTTETSRSSSAPYRTTDMTEAAFLAMSGFGYKLERDGQTGRGKPKAAWAFDSREELPFTVAEFNEGEARVEPVRFRRKLDSIRIELYEFLGISTRGVQRTSRS